MNPEEELENIRRLQRYLSDQVTQLDRRIDRVVESLQTPTPAPEAEPIAEKEAAPTAFSEPAVIATRVETEVEAEPLPKVSTEFTLPPEPARSEKKNTESGALEMKLGSYWFVRVGVAMLLTGGVFLANYAREQFFNLLPAGGKVAVLYTLSALLLATGLWLERRREELKSYARVLAAGGIAAVYYTTYAAHKVEILRVIDSPVIAGILLLLWAGVLLYISHRRDSQSLALTSVFFAYVTCVIIDRATVFTLFSALVLTIVGVFLLMRSRWIRVSFVSLAGTYLTFAYWRFPALIEWLQSSPPDSQNFLLTYTFLIAYWVLFSFAVFASKEDALPAKQRLGFAISNNAAFILLFSLGMLRHRPDDFGLFLLITGAALTGLHLLAKRRFPETPALAESFLISGVLAMTLGAVMHFSGYSLALTLAAESTALLIAARRTKNTFLTGMSYAAAIICAVYIHNAAQEIIPVLFTRLTAISPIHWLAALATSLLVLLNGYIDRNRGRDENAPDSFGTGASAIFVICGLVIAYFGCIQGLDGPAYPLTLALSGIAASCCLHFLRYRILAVLGQVFNIIAALHYSFANQSRPAWVGIIVVSSILYLAYWWRDARKNDVGTEEIQSDFLRDAFSIFGVLTLGLWIHERLPNDSYWLLAGGALAIGIFIAGIKTRMPAIAFAAMGFHLCAFVSFLESLHDTNAAILLIPIFLIGATPAIARHFLKGEPQPLQGWNNAILWIQPVLRIAVVILTTLWILQFIDGKFQPLSFGILAIAVTAVSVFLKNPAQRITATAFLIIGAIVWSFDVFARPPYGWANGLFCFAPLVMQVLVKQNSKLTPWLAAGTCLMIWRFVTGIVADTFGGFYLTVSWAAIALALFAIGFLLRERTYRWGGLGILAISIFRLGIDVWALDPVPRIFSFIAIGLVLVALGFVYNRWQDTIRKFL